MCGIAACWKKDGLSKDIVNNILKRIIHRGPDNCGILSYTDVTLGSCRLSILDLSDNANMPMQDKSGRFTIVYNGELYNYLELKKKFNIQTRTTSDTEIVVELYSLLKQKCLDEFNGIFSFIIYDKEEESFFGARDKIGVKPFYYIFDKGIFLASSEIKALSPMKNQDLNLDYVRVYLATSYYEYGENTFYNYVKQLKAGFFLKFFIKKNKIDIQEYWDLKKTLGKKDNITSENDLIKIGSNLIEDSFKLQMRTDAKFGLNISSGLDSKMMLCFVNKVNQGQQNIIANSFYFDNEQFSEKLETQEFADKIQWKVNFFKISPVDIINNFDEVLKAHDGPFPGVNTIAKSVLIKEGYDSNHKVVLEAQGGDDIAGGYKYIFGPFFLDLFKSGKITEVFKESKYFSNNEGLSLIDFTKFFYNSLKSFYKGGYSADGTLSVNNNILRNSFLRLHQLNLLEEITNDIKKINSNLDKILFRDLFYSKLPRILKSCDRVSMMHGKELRVPLLDHRLVEFFFKLENQFKIKNGQLRCLYRKIFDVNFPNNNAYKKKKYISDPQQSWLKNELFDWAYSILSEKKTFYDGIYNTKKLLKEFQKFKNDFSKNNSNIFWQALCLKRMGQIF